ncbi:protein phosphatase CheZ [Sulfuricystis multivorans]|uniref:protein phosphatase CheZ n=1 Tax=Sulfuricystis multivorans TaxID=2211108 RepID=UPI000F8363CA|nr:protein phosphatase CheZ [Sulfuricystis multivorans]
MAKPIKFDESGDSADLQALFDSIAASAVPQAAVVREPDASGDSDELQALFDSVAAQVEAATSASDAGASEAAPEGEAVFNRIGHLARKLHDSLRELGLDKALEDTARQIPDAQGRLHYIAQMTEQAASKVLNACDIAKPAQDELATVIKALGGRWEKMFANQLSVEEFKQLAADTRSFFTAAPARIALVNAQLNEIMLAQDFQDLTGQVIKKVLDIVQNVEAQLLQLLIETMPAEKRAAAPEGLMNGPVIGAEGCSDVVTSQQQVDDLLESLGF